MPEFYDISIKEIQQETALAISVLFDIPQNLKDSFSFTAGEYLTLEKEINGEQVRRAYSICSSPNSGELCVAIKKVPNGLFSVDAVDNFKVGDSIKVAAPEGRFLLTPEANKNYLAVAAGSGITPILSMIKSVLTSESSSTFTLIYGNKSVSDTMFYDELVSLSEGNDNFNLEFVFSRERNSNAKFGRIDKGLTNLFVKNKYHNINFDSAFLCGPEAMIETVSETLKENGFSGDAIHFELFSVSVDEDSTAQIEDGKCSVEVLLDDEVFTFEMDKSDDVLAASLRNDVDAPYSCQGGVCSSCLAKVTEGKAVMTKNSILTNAEVEEGYILTCQAHPTTSTLKVDFDDV
ncbi:MAG: 2Fe-2S iron-sulfur cluster-binding protein [Polaribacter sp.]|jgi:ring-1,2-phenylacetyl-CoA epoxidase subunit PaaE